jgi:excisionase family DNA binding protein
MEYLTAKEVAALLKVRPVTVYRMAKRGDLRRVKFGRLTRFSKQDLLLTLCAKRTHEGLRLSSLKKTGDDSSEDSFGSGLF